MGAGWVFDVKRFSVHDGPGIRTTIFLKGCPLQCLWCCNPESQEVKPRIVCWHERCIHCDACMAVCPQSAIVVDPPINADGASEAGRKRVLPERCDLCGQCLEVCYAGALDQMLTALAPGQSEHPDHPHYRDGIPDWLAGRSSLLATGKLLVEEVSLAHLVLEPVR